MAAGTVRYVATSGNDTNNDCTDSANPCLTIANGTNQSNAGDTVEVAAGTYNEHVAISRDLTIAGAGAGSTIVDGTNNGRVFDIGNVTVSISDLTIQNGHAPDGASGADCNPTGQFCNADGVPGEAGGAIRALTDGTLTLTDVTFSNNQGGDGGNGGKLNCSGGFTNCYSSGGSGGHGGAVEFFPVSGGKPGTAVVTDCIFTGNHGGAGGKAGTLNCTNGATCSGSDGSLGFGGGIDSEFHQACTIKRSTFTGNSGSEGGAIMQLNVLLDVSDSTFAN
ncbi:MAG: hypothetical protein ACJ8I9_07300, partial [Chthoniobacterales bacterium]